MTRYRATSAGRFPYTAEEEAEADAEAAANAETPQQIMDRLEAAVQRHLDAAAQQRGYDHMLSLATYATSTHERFAAEGQAGVEWRDDVWQSCLEIMAEVQAGQRPVPTEAELIALLPAIVWPE